METALQTAPGRCLINSVNLEAGRAKAERVFALAKKYNAAVIALTIDEQGMAKTADRKVEVARRIYDMAVDEFGLRPQDLVFDALTFTLATGDPEFTNSAVETLEGIRQIKEELPGRTHLAGRLECFIWPFACRPCRAEQRHAVSCRAKRAGYGHRQPGPYHPLRGNFGRRAPDRRRPDLQPPARCSAAVDRAF